MSLDYIQKRDALMRNIRAFFYAHDFLEVESPIRIKSPCLELNIDAEPSGDCFLRTSPELFHKRLLARGYERIFELGKCFRQGEYGLLHHAEYTMLEWYRANADYTDVLTDLKGLVAALALQSDCCCAALGGEWTLLRVGAAFRQYAGWDPVLNYDEDRFDIDLVEKVEPALRSFSGPVVLIDYPIEAAALARPKIGEEQVAERWELYINGIEIANAYSELIDPQEQRRRFEVCARQRLERDKPVYALDEEFLNALEQMPPSGGVALGVDRLLMLFTGCSSLDPLLPFR